MKIFCEDLREHAKKYNWFGKGKKCYLWQRAL